MLLIYSVNGRTITMLEAAMTEFKEDSMAGVFQNNVMKYGDRPCVAYKKDGRFHDISWNEMNVMVRNCGLYLISRGIKKGDKVALFSPNRYEWWVADQAILGIGAVNVPIYATNSAEEALYVLKHSEAKICFTGEKDHMEKVLSVKKKCPKLKEVVIFDEPEKKKTGVLSIREVIEKGKTIKDKKAFDARLRTIKQKDMATIIYTSGTTGDPKGVMLSHGNFVSNVLQIKEDFEYLMADDNVLLSFLPLSHSLERTAGYYFPMAGGAKVAFAEDFSTILQDLLAVRPTFLISVPRLYEKMHSGVLSKVAEASPIKQAIFRAAMKTAQKNLKYVCEEKLRKGLFAIRFNFFDKLLFSKLKEALGLDKIKLAVSGGGPLSVSDAEFFLGMGLIILEGFGLTETTPVTNVNRPGEIKPGSVGRALMDTEVKISDEGEILIRGPQVMMGYYKNPAATKEVFTRDGFFKTGDIGIIDEIGRLSITGRIKDIIVTAGGKNISPQNIENCLKASHYIEQVAVIGDRRKYLSALIVPAFEELKAWAKRSKIEFTTNADLLANTQIRELFQGEIEKYMKNFARVEQIRKFQLLDAEWTQDTGELTPSQKVKRRVIEEKYGVEIEKLYQNE